MNRAAAALAVLAIALLPISRLPVNKAMIGPVQVKGSENGVVGLVRPEAPAPTVTAPFPGRPAWDFLSCVSAPVPRNDEAPFHVAVGTFRKSALPYFYSCPDGDGVMWVVGTSTPVHAQAAHARTLPLSVLSEPTVPPLSPAPHGRATSHPALARLHS